jgi:hypothetical protein
MYLINNCYQFLGLNNNVPAVNEKTTIEAPLAISLKKKRPKLNRPCPKSKKRFQIDQFSPVVVPGKDKSPLIPFHESTLQNSWFKEI